MPPTGATTLPMVIYASVRLGVSPQINALATLVVSVAIVIARWLMFARERRQMRRHEKGDAR